MYGINCIIIHGYAKVNPIIHPVWKLHRRFATYVMVVNLVFFLYRILYVWNQIV